MNPINNRVDFKPLNSAYEPDGCPGCKHLPEIFHKEIDGIVIECWAECKICEIKSLPEKKLWEAIKEWNHMTDFVREDIYAKR